MTHVTFHPLAEGEFLAAVRFYDTYRPGLGLEFIAEVRHATSLLANNPAIGPRFSRRLRRLLVRKFPYGLLYRVESDGIFIVAVAHLHRRPGYWQARMRPRRV